MKKKNGFISMTLVYSFLIIFLFLMLAILNAYTQKNKYIEAVYKKLNKDIKNYVIDYSNTYWTFSYNNDVQSFRAIETGYYKIELYGAAGYVTTGTRGLGGYTSGIIKLEKDDLIYIYIGQSAYSSLTNTSTFNGTLTTTGFPAGGSTDIRLVSNASWNDAESLRSRIMVASGGGSTTTGIAGNGFGLYGGSATGSVGAMPYSSNGTTGLFGYANGTVCAGGNGYYSSVGAACTSGTGGGSSYISGYAGVNSINDNATITHNKKTKHYSGLYFINGKMHTINSADSYYSNYITDYNGHAIITYVSTSKPERINTNLNNVRYIKNCSTGSSVSEDHLLMEIEAIYNGDNRLKGLSPTTTIANQNYATDGDISSSYISIPVVSNASTCVTYDLGTTYNLDEISVWNYWIDGRTFNDLITQTSSDDTTYNTIISDASSETSEGKRVSAYE